jgi:hypothetical protein
VLHSSERFFDKEAFLEVGLNVSLTLLLIMDLSSQFGTVPVQFPCKTMMRTPQSLGLLPRFMFHGSKIEVYSHEKEALLSRYSSVQITVVISTLPFAGMAVPRYRMVRTTSGNVVIYISLPKTSSILSIASLCIPGST